MRIIAGSKRGMNLLSPPGRDSRPITDRVKQSLYDVLQNYDLPAGKSVADIFAGVGSLGLEALSRGAIFVTFVEQNPQIAPVLKQNIEKAKFTGQSKIIKTDAFSVAWPMDAEHPQSASADKYDLVFVDPPYVDSANTQAGSPLAMLLTRLSERVSAGGFVIVRTHRNTVLSQSYGPLRIIETRQWGNMAVTILKKT